MHVVQKELRSLYFLSTRLFSVIPRVTSTVRCHHISPYCDLHRVNGCKVLPNSQNGLVLVPLFCSKRSKSQWGDRDIKKDKERYEELKKAWQADPKAGIKLAAYVVVIGFSAFLISFYISKLATTDPGLDDLDRNILASDPIDMDQFLTTFLPSGEVEKVTYFVNRGRAVAWLKTGAIIGGVPVEQPAVVIKYELGDGRPASQFRAEIRSKEKKLGISLHNGLPVEEYYGFTTVKMVELLIGLLILTFLATQYGRLIRAKLRKGESSVSGHK